MNNRQMLVIILSILFLSTALTSIFYVFYNIKDVKEIPVVIKVGPSVGMNVDNDALRFGMIPRGGSGSRTFNLTNDYDVDLRATFRAEGENVIELIKYPAEEIIIKSGESKQVSVSAFIPVDYDFGEYKGKLIVLMKRK